MSKKHRCPSCKYFDAGEDEGTDICTNWAVQFIMNFDQITYLQGRGGCQFHHEANPHDDVTLEGLTREEWVDKMKARTNGQV